MSLTDREFWTVIHGLVLGAIYLLGFSAGLVGLWSFRPEWVTVEGIRERLRRLQILVWGMALVAWATVITGTYIVYPWYRAKVPDSPRSILLGDPSTELWHRFGMEWKEHIGWVTPILATAVAFMVSYYGPRLAERHRVRYGAIILFAAAFAAAAVAGVFGAFITKVAPLL
ncbi:MAG: hypothetical protein ACE5NC_00400 [Anaerolineae bacterium]